MDFSFDKDNEDAAPDGPSFSQQLFSFDDLGIPIAQKRITYASAANGGVLLSFGSGEVMRWYPMEAEASLIDFGKDKKKDVSKIFQEPKGFHALFVTSNAETWYLRFVSNQAKLLQKLKGYVIDNVTWDKSSTEDSTRDIFLGTLHGQILHVVINNEKEEVVKMVFEMPKRTPLLSLYCDTRPLVGNPNINRIFLIAATSRFLYNFVGNSVDSLFSRYQGDKLSSALMFEMPREISYTEMHIDMDSLSFETRCEALFWLTGAGLLVVPMKDSISDSDNASALEQDEPLVIQYPSKPGETEKGKAEDKGLIASLLPSPPAPPLSMALTKFHIIFLFQDRMAFVSRINHETVSQQMLSQAQFGTPMQLFNDSHGSAIWMCSDRNTHIVTTKNEDSDVWKLYLRQEKYDEALRWCNNNEDRHMVIQAHANYLFKRGDFIEAGKKFAETPSIPFEHVALKFMHANQKIALLEYLMCILASYRTKPDPRRHKVQLVMLSVWAIELALSHLNHLQLKGRSNEIATARESLLGLLKQCKDLDVHKTVYHMLQSHGWMDELIIYAEHLQDYETVIVHYMSQQDYEKAITKMGQFQRSPVRDDLVYRFAPVLFAKEPNAFVSLLMRPEFISLNPLPVLPALYTIDPTQTVHRGQAIRYLEFCVKHHPELVGLQGTEEGSVSDHHMTTSGKQGWTSGTAILNMLALMYSHGQEEIHEEKLTKFFDALKNNPLSDQNFALRVCEEQKKTKTIVRLYGLMGMHQEAVDVALERDNLALAKHNLNHTAWKPSDRPMRVKLWSSIVQHQSRKGDVQSITNIIKESQLLGVKDVLPFMSDSMTIDSFKSEICECLDTYEQSIMSLRREMDEHRRAAEILKEDLKAANQRCIVLSDGQECEICGMPLISERFYAFTCCHCFHQSCLHSLIYPILDGCNRADFDRLEEEIGRTNNPQEQASILAQLDDILADDCPLCGKLMIQTIARPFISKEEDNDEIQSWAIEEEGNPELAY